MQYRLPSHLIALFVSVILSTAAFAADPLAVRYYEDAVSRFNNGDTDGALIQLKNALQRDPGQLSAKILLGRVHLKQGNPLEAEEQLIQAQQLGADALLVALPLAKARNALGKYDVNIESIVPIQFPFDQQSKLWVELGLARLFNGDTAGATIAFKEALKITPNDIGAKIGLTRIPFEDGRYSEAERLADEITSIEPYQSEAWYIKGAAAHAQGKFDDAANAYGRAYELDPLHLRAAVGEAAALMDGNQPAKAAALLRDLKTAYPNAAAVPYLLYKALSRLDLQADAKKALATAATIIDQVTPADLSGNLEDMLLFGTIAFENNALEQAFQFLNSYVNSGGSSIRGRKMLARTLISMDRPTDALGILARITANQNTDAETLSLLGDASLQLGDFAAAEHAYKRALTEFNGGPQIARALAMAQFYAGQTEQSFATMQQLLELLPEDGDLNTSLLLGFLYLTDRRLNEAENIAKAILEKHPDNHTAKNFLATTLLNQGRRTEARDIYTSILTEDPTFRPARFNIVKMDIAENRLAEASEVLTRMLSQNPNDTQAIYEFAQLELRREDTRNAINLLERLRELRPTWIVAIRSLVNTYLLTNRRADALSASSDLMTRVPNNIEAHILLARTQTANQDREGAIATLKKASLLAGNNVERLFEVGKQQMDLGALEDAAWSLTKVAALEPGHVDARHHLAGSLFRMGKTADAEREIKSLRIRHPENIPVQLLLADVRQSQRRFNEAIGLYRDALTQSPDTVTLSSLYRALMLNDQPEAAVAELASWLENEPSSTIALNLMAEHYLTRGDSTKAANLYEKLAEIETDNPQVLNNLAIALTDIDGERALKAALGAHRLAPDNPFVLDTLGWAMVQLGDLEKGLGYLREARARNGRSPTVRYHIGVALQEYGKNREALAELKSALSLDQHFPKRDDALRRINQLEAMFGR